MSTIDMLNLLRESVSGNGRMSGSPDGANNEVTQSSNPVLDEDDLKDLNSLCSRRPHVMALCEKCHLLEGPCWIPHKFSDCQRCQNSAAKCCFNPSKYLRSALIISVHNLTKAKPSKPERKVNTWLGNGNIHYESQVDANWAPFSIEQIGSGNLEAVFLRQLPSFELPDMRHNLSRRGSMGTKMNNMSAQTINPNQPNQSSSAKAAQMPELFINMIMQIFVSLSFAKAPETFNEETTRKNRRTPSPVMRTKRIAHIFLVVDLKSVVASLPKVLPTAPFSVARTQYQAIKTRQQQQQRMPITYLQYLVCLRGGSSRT
eukprot:TCALIF_01260-PA protein Name:"Protein of unknown function" AED:0.71 eAED:0.71 QI:0/0/0/0.2/1/1/5/0/315